MSVFVLLESALRQAKDIKVYECDDTELELCIDGVRFSICSTSHDPQCGSALTVAMTDESGEVTK